MERGSKGVKDGVQVSEGSEIFEGQANGEVEALVDRLSEVDWDIEVEINPTYPEDIPPAEIMRLRGALISGLEMMEGGFGDLMRAATIEPRLELAMKVYATGGRMVMDAIRHTCDDWLAERKLPAVSLYPVSSSNLSALGWAGDQGETPVAVVEFKNGGLYAYEGVPENVFTEWWEAPSQGVYLSQEIKGNYEFRRLA